jgi:hypothetical protein
MKENKQHTKKNEQNPLLSLFSILLVAPIRVAAAFNKIAVT